MVKLTNEQRKFIIKHFENHEEILKMDVLEMVLREFDRLYLDEGVDQYDEPTDFGYEIERVMDNIYYQNVYNEEE